MAVSFEIPSVYALANCIGMPKAIAARMVSLCAASMPSTDKAWERIEEDSGFVSGRSLHEDRVKTIRLVNEKYAQVIDPHTADGVKIAMRMREPRYPMICLETALAAKFDATIVEALGSHPPRPARFEGIEKLPQRVTLMKPDAQTLKRFIAEHAGGAARC